MYRKQEPPLMSSAIHFFTKRKFLFSVFFKDEEMTENLDHLQVNGHLGRPFMGNGLMSVDEIDRLLETDGNASDMQL